MKTVRLLRSRPVTDRGSVFVAHLAFPVSTEAEANAALSALKRTCTGDVVDHVMSAWRVPKRGTGRGEEKRKPAAARKKTPVETFFDDDGEARGGASIRAELNKLDAVGVVCVVTRAYGGVNLGKKRFEHIRERVSRLFAAAGIEPGELAREDAFRDAGRAHVLGGGSALTDSLATALGGVGGRFGGGKPAENSRVDANAVDISRGFSASAGVSALFSKRRRKETPKTLPPSVADDIRARLAEAAERRRLESATGTRAANEVIDLCDDDEPAKRARNA